MIPVTPVLRARKKFLKGYTGTWNVRTLNADGKIDQLEHEQKCYTWNIIGLAEARLTGVGDSKTPQGNQLFHSGQDKRHANGTTFLIHKDTAGAVMEFKPISDRVIYIRLRVKPFNLSVMQIYAPTTDATDDQLNRFYDAVTATLQGLPNQDIHLLMWEWNAKIGPDAYDQLKGTIGRSGLPDWGLPMTEVCAGLLEFAQFHELTICNTFQAGKLSRKATFHSPNGKTHNMIDYIMVDNRFRSSIKLAKTRTFPGADVGSDLDLVLTALWLKNIEKKQSMRVSYNLDKLKDNDIAEQFQVEVGGRFAPLLTLELEPEEFQQQVEDN
ncbi:craniofacial development protein 2-like [Lineus longissimus]|uniref:craniofacial development protein 2-like n=1 Tax=Lineus longissimus TaxID=88925 RepID=UPI00315C7FCA